MAEKTQDFPGFYRPRYTPIPDALFDTVAPDLTPGELRVLLYIMRRTFGFQRDDATISFQQLCTGRVNAAGERLDRGAGISSATAQAAVKGLIARGMIRVIRHTSAERGNEPSTYTVCLRADAPPPPPVINNRQRGGSKVTPPPPLKVDKGGGQKLTTPLYRETESRETENTLEVSTSSVRAASANDVTLLAETWMKANIIDPAQAIGGTIVQYRKWAKDILTRWDRATITRLLRYQYSQRKARGDQYTITPALLDQRIGQWQEMGSPATFTESPRKKGRDPRTPEMQAYDHPRWPGVCACGKEEKSKHKEGCLIGGAVTWDWYIDPATGKPPPHVQARLDAP